MCDGGDGVCMSVAKCGADDESVVQEELGLSAHPQHMGAFCSSSWTSECRCPHSDWLVFIIVVL